MDDGDSQRPPRDGSRRRRNRQVATCARARCERHRGRNRVDRPLSCIRKWRVLATGRDGQAGSWRHNAGGSSIYLGESRRSLDRHRSAGGGARYRNRYARGRRVLGFPKVLRRACAGAPLVLVFEDLHWGEDRLLDFIEELVERNDGAAMLVVCLARPDLLEKRPAWGGGKLDAETIQLTPLSEASSHELIRILGEAVSDEAQGQIAARADGNPLFIEQLVALSLEDPKAPSDAIPPSIHAVLAARVDRLARVERELLERASIIGLESARRTSLRCRESRRQMTKVH